MQTQDLDKCKRRIIRTVARRLLYEKQPEDVVWEALAKDTGCDCRTLWNRMRSLTIKKLDRLLTADDCRDKIAPVAQMTKTDWLLCDLVLVHEDVDLIGWLKPNCRKDTKPLCALFTLVQKFDIEGETNHVQIAKKWAAAAAFYNKKGIQCSPMLLQRRWYQLKEILRENFYNMWQSYKGNQRLISNLQKDRRPTVLQSAVAKRYPRIVTTPLLKWDEMIKKKLVVLPEEIESHSRGFVDIPPTEEDVIMLEQEIETIDLGVEDDKESDNDAANTSKKVVTDTITTSDDAVNIVEETAKAVDVIENTEESQTDGLSNVRIVTATHVPVEEIDNDISDSPADDEAIVLSNDNESDDNTLQTSLETPKSSKQGHNIETVSDDLTTPPVPDDVNELLKGKLHTIKHNLTQQQLKESVIRDIMQSDKTANTIEIKHEKNEVKEIEPSTSATKINEVISLENDDDVPIEQPKKKRPMGPLRMRQPERALLKGCIEDIVREKAIKYIHNKDKHNLTKSDTGNVTQPNEEKSVDINSIIKNKAEEFIRKAPEKPVLTDEDEEEIDYFQCDMIKNTAMDDIIKEKADQFVRGEKDMNIQSFGGNTSYASGGVEIVDEGIEYTDDEDASENSPVDNIKTAESSEEPNFDKKLLMQPIVYTTRLDDMASFKGLQFSEIRSVHIISDVIAESKPQMKIKTPEEHIEQKLKSELVEIDEVDEVSETSDDDISDEFRVKPTSYLLRKPKARDYNLIQLCKNPDFNTRLKRLTVGFLSSTRNRALLKQLKPMTIDLHKAFESKLINGTLYLKPGDVSKPLVRTECHEIQSSTVLPSAMPIQCLIDNVIKDLSPQKSTVGREVVVQEKVDSFKEPKRNKVIRLPNIEEIRRINEKLLTAKVAPIVIENYIGTKDNVGDAVGTEISSNVKHITPNVDNVTDNTNDENPIVKTAICNSNTTENIRHTETSHQSVSVPGKNTDATATQSIDSQNQTTHPSTSQTVTQREKPAPRKAPPVPWYSSKSRTTTKPDDEILLTNDTLFKMIYHISGDYDKSIEKKGKKFEYKPDKIKPKNTKKPDKPQYCCYFEYLTTTLAMGKKAKRKHLCKPDNCWCCCRHLCENPSSTPVKSKPAVLDSEQSLRNACASIETVVAQSQEKTDSEPHVYIEKASDVNTISNVKTRIVSNLPKTPKYNRIVVNLDFPMITSSTSDVLKDTNKISETNVDTSIVNPDASINEESTVVDLDSPITESVDLDSSFTESETVTTNEDMNSTKEPTKETSVVDLSSPIMISDKNTVEVMPMHKVVTKTYVSHPKTIKLRNIQELTTNKEPNKLIVRRVTSDKMETCRKIDEEVTVVENVPKVTLPFSNKVTTASNILPEIKITRPPLSAPNIIKSRVPYPCSVSSETKNIDNFIVIDGSKGQPETPNSVVGKKHKITRVSLTAPKNDTSVPIFIGEGNVLLSTVSMGRFKLQRRQQKSPLPNGVSIAIALNGDIKYNVDAGTVMTVKELESLPGIISAIKEKIAETNNVVGSENMLSMAKGEGIAINMTEVINIDNLGGTDTNEIANSSEVQPYIIDVTSNAHENLQMAEVSSPFNENTPQSNKNTPALMVPDIESNNIDIGTDSTQNTSSGTRNLLSDLMEMSGISEEDINPIAESTPKELVPTINIPPLSEIVIPNPRKVIGLHKYTELICISSLSELKHACSKDATFFKLNCSTGIAVRIDVCVKKNAKLPAQKNERPAQTIDLTDEIEDKQEPTILTQQKKLPVITFIDKKNPVPVKLKYRPILPKSKIFKVGTMSGGTSVLKQVKIVGPAGKSILKKTYLVPREESETIELEDDNTTNQGSKGNINRSLDLLRSFSLEDDSTNFEESTNVQDEAEKQTETVTVGDELLKSLMDREINEKKRLKHYRKHCCYESYKKACEKLGINVSRSHFCQPENCKCCCRVSEEQPLVNNSENSEDSSDEEPLAKKVKRKQDVCEETNVAVASTSTLEATEPAVPENSEPNVENVRSESNIETFESSGEEMELDNDIRLTFFEDNASSEDEDKKTDDDCILGF